MRSATKRPVESRENLSSLSVTGRLKPERVQLLLNKLPDWRVSQDGKSLSRTFKFTCEGTPLAFAGFVMTLATQASHFPAVTLHRSTLTCKLTTPAAGGLTLKDFEMARRISLLG
jgi:4a-hydroxytetrahydrobiopterin dehydratase